MAHSQNGEVPRPRPLDAVRKIKGPGRINTVLLYDHLTSSPEGWDGSEEEMIGLCAYLMVILSFDYQLPEDQFPWFIICYPEFKRSAAYYKTVSYHEWYIFAARFAKVTPFNLDWSVLHHIIRENRFVYNCTHERLQDLAYVAKVALGGSDELREFLEERMGKRRPHPNATHPTAIHIELPFVFWYKQDRAFDGQEVSPQIGDVVQLQHRSWVKNPGDEPSYGVTMVKGRFEHVGWIREQARGLAELLIGTAYRGVVTHTDQRLRRSGKTGPYWDGIVSFWTGADHGNSTIATRRHGSTSQQ